MSVAQSITLQAKPNTMLILQKQEGGKGSFYIEENKRQVAELEYTLSAEKTLTIVHTEVDEHLQGKQIGEELVDAVANFARAHQYKVKPKCTYAAALMKRKSRFSDLLG